MNITETSNRYAEIYQNLKDAGCDDKTIEKCMTLVRSCSYEGLIPILLGHRKTLLRTVRIGQRQIDCLDYLIYKIQKENI